MGELSTPTNVAYAVVKTPSGHLQQARSSFSHTGAPLQRSGPSAWSSKFRWVGNAAQFLVVGVMMVYIFAQLAVFTNLYHVTLRNQMGTWWNVPITPTKKGEKQLGNPEMIRPTFFFLFCVFPFLISLLLVELLRHFHVRRISSRFVLQFAMVMRRKPRVFGKYVSYWSYGEWVFFLGFLVLGNVLCFYFNLDRRITRTLANLKKENKPMQIPFNSYLSMIAVSLGFNCIYNMAFLFLPATRNCAWMEFFNISYANGVKYHRWLGVATVLTAVLHCVGYYWMWIRKGTWVKEAIPCVNCDISKGDGYHSWFNFFGELALLCFLVISITSIPYIRRRLYEVFYYAHHLFIPAVILSVMHWGPTIWWIYPTFMVYVVSRCISSSNAYAPVQIKAFEALDNDIIKLVISRSVLRDGDFKVGQFVYLNVPHVSKLQWHAFTIASSPRTSATTLTILAKSLGDWTQELIVYAEECKKSSMLPTVYMDGYYGTSLEMYDEYSTVCLVGGGIGVTPLFSILEDMVAKLIHGDSLRQKVVFVFTFRELALLEEIHPVLMKLKELDPMEQYHSLHLYLTRVPSSELLNQPIDHERLNGQSHLLSVKYDNIKARTSPKPFAEPLRSRTYKVLTYIALFSISFVIVVVLQYGGGKIDGPKGREHLWPLQQFVEVLMLFCCGFVVYAFIYLDNRNKKKRETEFANKFAHHDECDATSIGSTHIPGSR